MRKKAFLLTFYKVELKREKIIVQKNSYNYHLAFKHFFFVNGCLFENNYYSVFTG